MTRARDIALLRALLADVDRLKDGEAEAFQQILANLHPNHAKSLRQMSAKQRAWVADAAERLEIEDPTDDPRERNRDIPRGRDVPVPAVLQHLPKAPPWRKVTAW